MRLSRGQIVGLITIVVLLIIFINIANIIFKYNKEKIDYLAYDKKETDILLKGNYLEYVSLNSVYKDKGVYSKEKPIISYFKDGNEVVDIDSSYFGTYQVRYYFKNGDYISRVVVIVDDESPTIKVPDKQVITKSQVKTFDLKKDVVVTDNSDEVYLTYEGKLLETKGDYIITYIAKDASGNTAKKKRLIEVID